MKKVFSFFAKYTYSLLAAIYLFTLGIFSGRERAFLGVFASHFGLHMGKKIPTLLIPEVSPNEVMSGSEAIVIREPEAVSGNVSLLELTLINWFVKKTRARNLFHIGTFDQRTILNMAADCSDGPAFTLDLASAKTIETEFAITGDKKFIPNQKRTLRFVNTPEENKIKRLFGDSATFDFSPFKNQIDLLFIDGAHTYEYVTSDTKRTESIMREHGLILWHDYGTWEGVTRGLNELYKTNSRYANIKHIKGTSLAYLYL